MDRDRDDEYRYSKSQLHAFLSRAGEISSDDQPKDDELDALIDEDHISRGDSQAALDYLLNELGNDPVEESSDVLTNHEPATPDQPVLIKENLDADGIDAVERLNEKSDALQAVYQADARYPEHLKVSTPEEKAVLAERSRLLRACMAERERRNAASKAYWSKLYDEASARIHAPERKAKADARAARDVARKRNERAGQITAKRVSALEDAIANHGGDHRLVKLAGRAGEYAQFREALTAARRQHGPKASLTKIAAIWSTMAGAVMTKDQCRKRLEVVGKLEAQGGPWYRWRAS